MNFIKTNIGFLKKRGTIVFSNTANSLISPFTNIVFSFLLIRLSGIELWGSFVYYFLYATLVSIILNWGNRDFLLREFSKEPASISSLWLRSFFTRLVLLLPLAIVLFVSFPGKEPIIIFVWGFLIFAVSSFDPLVTYYRKFLPSVFAEVVSSVVMFALIYLFSNGLNLKYLLLIYSSYYIVKISWYIFMFAGTLSKQGGSYSSGLFEIKVLGSSAMFFVLGLTGMLGSRIDQYIVAYYLPIDALGSYQVLKNFLLYFQSVAVFMVFPFVKNIYRLKDESLNKLNKVMIVSGLIIVVPIIFFLWIILSYVYKLAFSFDVYILSGLFILPSFFYLISVYRLFKYKKEKIVLFVNLICISVSLILSLILLPSFGITGCLIAGTASGWISVLLYFIYDRFTNLKTIS